MAQPGDRICANCGEANDATRKFCRRCGTSLVTAQVVAAAKVPWYRRIFQRQPKQPKPMAAGDRVTSMQAGAKSGWRSLMQVRTLIVGALAIVIGLGVIGYVGVPGFSKYVSEFTSGGLPGIANRIGNFFNPPQVLERPSWQRSSASNEVADHPIGNLFDSRSNTDWRADGKQPSATITFPEKVDLLSTYIYSGTGGKDFVDVRRPATLQFTFPDGSSPDRHPPGHPRQAVLRAEGVGRRQGGAEGPDDERAGRCPGGHLRDRVLQEGRRVGAGPLELSLSPRATGRSANRRRRAQACPAWPMEADEAAPTPSPSRIAAYSRRSRLAAPVSPARSRASMSIRHSESW